MVTKNVEVPSLEFESKNKTFCCKKKTKWYLIVKKKSYKKTIVIDCLEVKSKRVISPCIKNINLLNFLAFNENKPIIDNIKLC